MRNCRIPGEQLAVEKSRHKGKMNGNMNLWFVETKWPCLGKAYMPLEGIYEQPLIVEVETDLFFAECHCDRLRSGKNIVHG